MIRFVGAWLYFLFSVTMFFFIIILIYFAKNISFGFKLLLYSCF